MFETISGVAKEVKQFLEEDGGEDDSSEDGVGVMSPAALSSHAVSCILLLLHRNKVQPFFIPSI